MNEGDTDDPAIQERRLESDLPLDSGADKTLLSKEESCPALRKVINVSVAKKMNCKEGNKFTLDKTEGEKPLRESQEERSTEKASKAEEEHSVLNVGKENENSPNNGSDIDPTSFRLDNSSTGSERDSRDNTSSLEDSELEIDVNFRPGTDNSVSMALKPDSHTYMDSTRESKPKDNLILNSQANTNNTTDSKWCETTYPSETIGSKLQELTEPENKAYLDPERNEIEDSSSSIPKTMFVSEVGDTTFAAQELDIPASSGTGLCYHSVPIYKHNTNGPEVIKLDIDANSPLIHARPKDSQPPTSNAKDGELQGTIKPENKAFLDPVEDRDFTSRIPKDIYVSEVDDTTSAAQELDIPTSSGTRLSYHSAPVYRCNTNGREVVKLDNVNAPLTNPRSKDDQPNTSNTTDKERQESIEPDNEELDPQRSGTEGRGSSRCITYLNTVPASGLDGNTSIAQGLDIYSSADTGLDIVTSSNNKVPYPENQWEASGSLTDPRSKDDQPNTSNTTDKERQESIEADNEDLLDPQRSGTEDRDSSRCTTYPNTVPASGLNGNTSIAQGLDIHSSADTGLDIVTASNNIVPYPENQMEANVPKMKRRTKRGHKSKRFKRESFINHKMFQNVTKSPKSGLEWLTALIALIVCGNRSSHSHSRKRNHRGGGGALEARRSDEGERTTQKGQTSGGRSRIAGIVKIRTAPALIFILFPSVNAAPLNSTPLPSSWQQLEFCNAKEPLTKQTLIFTNMVNILQGKQKSCVFNISGDPLDRCRHLGFYIFPVNDTCLLMVTDDPQTQQWMLEYGANHNGQNIKGELKGRLSKDQLEEKISQYKRGGAEYRSALLPTTTTQPTSPGAGDTTGQQGLIIGIAVAAVIIIIIIIIGLSVWLYKRQKKKGQIQPPGGAGEGLLHKNENGEQLAGPNIELDDLSGSQRSPAMPETESRQTESSLF